MNKITACAAALAALIAAPAFAADMAVKAPPPPPAPVYSWTGWYVGGNVGYDWGTANNSLSILQPKHPGVTGQIFSLSGTDSDRLRGVIGGVQAGYNWQTSNFLLGIETDFQGSTEKGSGAYNSAIIPPNPQFGPNPVSVTDSSKLDWLGTLRGRLGITSDRWLLYATGGLAYGEVNQSGNAQPANPIPAVFNAPFLWNHSITKVGWTIGAGVENAISANWSWKIEYLYIDLGNVTANALGGIGTALGGVQNCYGTPGGACDFVNGTPQGGVTSRLTDNILRVGLNYQFH